MHMNDKGNTAMETLPSSYYADHSKTIALPTVVDYILASRESACTGMNAAISGTCNQLNYLAKSFDYWTMTADGVDTSHIWAIVGGKLTSSVSTTSMGVRPVIYLKASTTFTFSPGNTNPKGASSNPYIVNS